MAGSGKGAVFLALLGNSFLTVIKFVAFLFSGSGAILSEAIHSLADSANQALLFIGIRRSQRPADTKYNYGYGIDRFLFALLSAVGIFVLGCGVTVYHGVESLVDPPSISINWIVFAVLGISLVVDGAVFLIAVRQVVGEKGKLGFFAFIRASSDPTLLAVLFEDFVAILGVLVASAGILLAHVTGEVYFDAISSILIGLMMGMIAVWLGWRNRQLILGPAIPQDIQEEMLAFITAQPSVDSARLVRTRIAAADRFTIAAEIDYNGRYLAEQHAEWVGEQLETVGDDDDRRRFCADFGERMMDTLAKEVDRLEAELFVRFPRLRDVSLESDWSDEALAEGAARRKRF